MLPPTPDQDTGHVMKAKMQDEYLPKAITKIVALIEHANPQVAFSAARWVAEHVLGKAAQPITGDAQGMELALALAQVMREIVSKDGMPSLISDEIIPIIISDNNVRVLGPAPEPVLQTKETTDIDFPG